MITDLIQRFITLFAACKQNCYYLLQIDEMQGLIMTQMKSYTIKLFNKSYEIKCPESEEANLLLAAQKLNNQLTLNKKKAKPLNEFHILLLSALNICRELVLLQSQQAHQRDQFAQLISALESKINKMVHSEVEQIMETDQS